MNNAQLWWLYPPRPDEAPTQDGVFVWRGTGRTFAKICGIVAGSEEPHIVALLVGGGVAPRYHLEAPLHLRLSGMSRKLFEDALRRAPLIYQPGMEIELRLYAPDVEAVALVVEPTEG